MKIAIATNQYWPIPGFQQNRLKLLADRLVASGSSVVVLSETLGDHCPDQSLVSDHSVVRFGASGWSFFNQNGFHKPLFQWLKTNTDQWDLLIVSANFEALDFLVSRVTDLKKPIFVLVESVDEENEVDQPISFPISRLKDFQSRSPFVHLLFDSIVRGGESFDSFEGSCRIPFRTNVPESGRLISLDQKLKLRNQFRTSVSRSRFSGVSQVVVVPVVEESYRHCEWIWEVVCAADRIRGNEERFPVLEFWILGDNRQLRMLNNRVSNHPLGRRLVFVGQMLDYRDTFALADLVFFPSNFPGTPFWVTHAIAQRVPVLCQETLAKNVLHGLFQNQSMPKTPTFGIELKEHSSFAAEVAAEKILNQLANSGADPHQRALFERLQSVQTDQDNLLQQLVDWASRDLESKS